MTPMSRKNYHAAQDAASEMADILDELHDLRERARKAIANLPPQIKARAEAYRVAEFGVSSNPYDTTFEKIAQEADEAVAEMGSQLLVAEENGHDAG